MADWIPITRPAIDSAEIDAMSAVLASGFLVQGPAVAEFERQVAQVSGTQHAVALTNCTIALHVALLSLGIGRGDRVLVTPYSWVATANVIELCGATPVFVDIDPHTFNLDAALAAELLESEAGRSIKAIMPVHTFGNPAGIEAIMALSQAHSIPVVEDAACALGATSNGQPAGSFGTIGCFSFHPRKIITTGEGGMLVTNDDALASFARSYRNHGQQVIDGVSQFAMAGQNLRITEFQGAMGVAQMAKLPMLVTQRSQLAARYDEALPSLGVMPQVRGEGAAVQSYVGLVPQHMAATDVIAALRSDGVEATIGTVAIPFTQHYREQYGLTEAQLPVTAALRDRALTLPLFPGMTSAQQDDVIAALGRAVA